MFFSSRPTAVSLTGKTLGAATALLIALALSTAPAMALNLAPETAVCPGQIFAQPFLALGDLNSYTLVSGSEFNNPPEGWELKGGAKVVSATHPDGSAGYALDLPSGAVAVSAPVCVTLQEETREVRFVLTAAGNATSTLVYGLYVDPWMK